MPLTLAAPSTVTVLRITHRPDALPTQRKWRDNRSVAFSMLERFAGSVVAGLERCDVDAEVDGADSVAASGTVTLSGASGSVGAVVNGVTMTTTASGGDAATATALASVINATVSSLVQGLVTATAAGAVVTVTSNRKGVTGNTQTLAATGTGATASGPRLAGGTAATTGTATGRALYSF